MTRRGFSLLLTALTALLCALSTGSRIYYLVSICFALALGYGLVCVLLLRHTLQASTRLNVQSVHRGESACLTLTVFNRCPLPVCPARVTLDMADVSAARQLPLKPLKESVLRMELPASHVGAYLCRASLLEVSDLFGLFRCKITPEESHLLLSLPKPFDVEDIVFAPGDTGKAALSRTQEDYTSPEDVRAYIPGDAMKRIHWKLSSRKKELLVRRYETPAPPDTLILVDQRAPVGSDRESCLSLRDAVCETAVAVAHMQLRDQSPVRAPFYGPHANEFASDNAQNLPLLQEMLALQPFDSPQDFARTLHLELRRMGRTGAAIIITTYLDAPVVDAISQMRRMGPNIPVYLVTFDPEQESLQRLVGQLQHHLVEVCYVTPA